MCIVRIESGDLLEREKAELIRHQLPNYERIWGTFIGNDGKSKMLPMPGLSAPQDAAREKFSEYHYSIFEAICCLDRIAARNSSIFSTDSYLDAINDFLLCHAHMGRLNDLLQRAFNQVKGQYDDRGLRESWTNRNIVLHDRKVPVIMIHDELFVAPIESQSVNAWNEKSTWSIPHPDRYKSLKETIDEAVHHAKREVNVALGALFAAARRYFNSEIQLADPTFSKQGGPLSASRHEDQGLSPDTNISGFSGTSRPAVRLAGAGDVSFPGRTWPPISGTQHFPAPPDPID